MATAVHAGTVYVPLPGVSAVGPVPYETQITVTNTLAQQRTVNSLQLATGVNGTIRTGLTPTALPVAAGRTTVLKPPATARGLLELSSLVGVHYSARLVGTGATASLGVELPVISSETMGRANERLVVQGLKSLGTRTADLVVVNLGKTQASCLARVLRADGTLAFPEAPLTLLPLSHRLFANIFSGVPAGIADARAEVTCNTDFYVYAHMTDTATGEFAVATPSESSASLLTLPGGTPTGLECSAGTACYVFPGLVHASTVATPDRAITLAPPAATYSAVKVHLEVTVGPWNPVAVTGAHGILYFVKNRNRDMFGNLFLRGPVTNQLTLRHGFNQAHVDKARIDQSLAAQAGETYVIDYVYDTARRVITLKATRDGVLVVDLVGTPNINQISILATDKINLGLSNPGTNPTIEPASIGWRYSNLKVEFFP
ncbi:MAG TPA: hypothetical protein VKK31_08955 [Thermoanaerobaculia bacterium]|nr:hypothetical protein [Thermoanaerobaculia bacterium]